MEQVASQANLMYTKTLSSLALLRANWNSDNDYLDVYVDFLATLIHKKQYQTIDTLTVCKDFAEEFGLIIPYHPMMTILSKATSKGLIQKNRHDHLYKPVEDMISALDFSHESQNQQRKLEHLIDEFIKYSQQYKQITSETAEKTIISFLHEYSIDIIDSRNKSVLPEADAETQEMYLLYKFVSEIHKLNAETFGFFVDLAIGNVLSNALMYDEVQHYKGDLANLDIYLDTPFIFRLLGFEGEARRESYEQFINVLLKQGAKFFVFTHTYEEIIGILRDCERWIDSEEYDPLLASPVLLHFVENSKKSPDVASYILNLMTHLEAANITTKDAPDVNEDQKSLIDEGKLFDIIVDLYSRSPSFNVRDREYSILRDVKSISSIYKLRDEVCITKINDAKCVFITTNASLAYANKKYEMREFSSQNFIQACLTDVFLGTIVWMQSPAEIYTLNEKKIIADCYAALQPNEILLKKFLKEIERLKTVGKIDSREYYVLRTYHVAKSLLEEKTLGDHERFTDRTTEEILQEIHMEIEAKASADAKEQINIAQEQLQSSESEKARIAAENKHIKTENEKIQKKFDTLVNIITGVISTIIFSLLLVIFILGTIAQINASFLLDIPILRWSIIIISYICGAVSVISGFNIKNLRSKTIQSIKRGFNHLIQR